MQETALETARSSQKKVGSCATCTGAGFPGSPQRSPARTGEYDCIFIYIPLKLPSIKKKILAVWGQFRGLEMSPLMLFCYC